MADILWKNSTRGTNPETPCSAQSLANNAAYLSAAVGNASALDTHADIHILADFSVAPTAGATIDVYFVEQDGTSYEDAATSGPVIPIQGYKGSMVLRAVTGPQRMKIRDLIGWAPHRDFKVFVHNNGSGQTGTITVKLDFRRRQAA